MRTNLTMAATAALACPLPAIPAAAQEVTVAEALEALERESAGTPAWNRPYHPARAILRQRSSPRPAAELDAFADRVAAIMADAALPKHVRSNAKYALAGAADTDVPHLGGAPYPRAFDLLVRVYEGGTYDDALFTIWLADDVRGPAYMRDVFERSERPPLCRWRYVEETEGGLKYSSWDGTPAGLPASRILHGWVPYGVSSIPSEPPFGGAACEGYYWRDAHDTPWCQSGGYLFGGVVAEAWKRMPFRRRDGAAGWPDPYPEGLPEHVLDWHLRCR